MPTIYPTLEEIRAGLRLPTGAKHTIVLPPMVVRVRMVGILFETDKTFILPSALPGIQRLKQVYDQHTGKTVLVSGHADRAGADSHNLALSVERAKAVAAFLQDADSDWLPRYDAGTQKSARWGTREDQYMLSTVLDGDGKPYFAGGCHRQGRPRNTRCRLSLPARQRPSERSDGARCAPALGPELHGDGWHHPANGDDARHPRLRRVSSFCCDG